MSSDLVKNDFCKHILTYYIMLFSESRLIIQTINGKIISHFNSTGKKLASNLNKIILIQGKVFKKKYSLSLEFIF